MILHSLLHTIHISEAKLSHGGVNIGAVGKANVIMGIDCNLWQTGNVYFPAKIF